MSFVVNLHYCRPLRAADQIADDLMDAGAEWVEVHRSQAVARVIAYTEQGGQIRLGVGERSGRVVLLGTTPPDLTIEQIMISGLGS